MGTVVKKPLSNLAESSGTEIGKEQVLVFLHIPKAAGTTLHDILMKQYPGIKHLVSNGLKTLNELKEFSSEETEEIGVIRGHMNFGVHELLYRPSVYITMLRDPVERVISHYYYLIQDPKHPLHPEYVSKNMSLEDFIFKTTDNDNGQTRAFAGVADTLAVFSRAEVPFGKCDFKILELAKKNLQKFSVVGLVSKFDETLILLKRVLGWKQPPLYSKQNVIVNRPLKESIPPETIDLIRQYNKLDMMLYEYATEIFEEQISMQDDSFWTEVEYFRFLNKAYQENQQFQDDYVRLQNEYNILRQEHNALQQSNTIILTNKSEEHPFSKTVEEESYNSLAKISPPSQTELIIYNAGERLIPGVTHDITELIRHRSTYAFFKKIIEIDIAQNELDMPLKIIDLGCGVGHGCYALAEIPGTQVHGVDMSEESIEYAKTNYSKNNISYQVVNLNEYIPTMPEYDYVVSRHVFEHIDNGLQLALLSKWSKRLMFEVPYDEPEGNPHHALLGIREENFSKFPEGELFFQDLEGIIYNNRNKPSKPNGIICVYGHSNFPRVESSNISFPLPGWAPEEKEYKHLFNQYFKLRQDHQTLVQEHQTLVQEHQVLVQEHQALVQEYEALLQEHQRLLETKAVIFAKELRKFPLLMKLASAAFAFSSRIYSVLKKR